MAEEFDNIDKINVKFDYGIPGVDFPIKKIEVNMGRIGIPGGKGDSGTFEEISKTALNDIAGFRFVSVTHNDQITTTIIEDDFLRNSLIGYTTHSIQSTYSGKIKTLGLIADSSFDFQPDKPVYVSAEGTVTQEEPEFGWIVEAGIAQTPDSFFLDFFEPYYKEAGTDGSSTGGAVEIVGKDGKSAYQIWLDANNSGTEADFLNSLKVKGDPGDPGKSAYEFWLETGGVGTLEDFVASTQGKDGATGTDGLDGDNGLEGAPGKSAYQVWLDLENVGTEADFINSLKVSKTVYTPPMSPVLMNQGDEVIISHPSISSGIKRSVRVWENESLLGLTMISSYFDLADISLYDVEDPDSVIFNGSLSLAMTGAPTFNSIDLDFRDAVRVPETGQSIRCNMWGMLNGATQNLSSDGAIAEYANATGIGHYFYTCDQSETPYAELTVPNDLPAGNYDLYIYGNTYWSTGAWYQYRIDTQPLETQPPGSASWYNASNYTWHKVGSSKALNPGSKIRFSRPNNQGANVGGVNYSVFKILPVGASVPVTNPTGKAGVVKNITAGSYPLTPTFVVTPAINVSEKYITKINSITSDAVFPSGTSINALISTDDGVTWNYYNGSSFVTLDSQKTLRQLLNENVYQLSTVLGWMSNLVCNVEWKIRLALDLKTTNILNTPSISTLSVNFDHRSCYKNGEVNGSYKVSIYDTTSVVVSKESSGSALTIIEVEI